MKWQSGTENDDVIDQRDTSSGGDSSSYSSSSSDYSSSNNDSSSSNYSSSTSSSSSSSSTGTIVGAAGAVIGGIVVAIVKLFGGGGGDDHKDHKTDKVKDTKSAHVANATTPPQDAGPRVDPDKEVVDFVKFVMKDIQETFEDRYKKEKREDPYRHAKLVLFTNNVKSGCGHEAAWEGPFYCPVDEHAYIDLSFFHTLATRYRSPGNFAEAYVLAHEVGHHLQKISGLSVKKSQIPTDQKSKNALSVRIELQADCFAGVWGHWANEKKLLEVGDLEGALNAASAIGSDKTQKGANPETFTHGTSVQRMHWFKVGFDSGVLDKCDTFGPDQI